MNRYQREKRRKRLKVLANHQDPLPKWVPADRISPAERMSTGRGFDDGDNRDAAILLFVAGLTVLLLAGVMP